MAKYRVAYLIRKTVGGMQKHLIDLVSGLDHRKYDLIIIAPDITPYQKALGEAVKLYELPLSDRIAPWSDARSTFKLVRLLKALRPDLLHIHSNKAALIGRIAARIASIRPVLLTVHNFLLFQEKGPLLRVPASWLERKLACWTTLIITVSDELKKALVEVEKIPADKIITVHNGIDADQWKSSPLDRSLRKKIGIPERCLLVGTVGRFVPFKGHAVLVEAMKILREKYPRLKAVIAGTGPLEAELIKQIDKLDLRDMIVLPGFVEDVRSLISSFDLFVLPSLKEPFGLVVLEAMVAGVPVVATRAGGVPEIIIDGENGLLVPPGDSLALAEKISQLLDHPALREKIVADAAKTVRQKFSLEEMVKKTENLYLESLAG